MVGHNLHHRTNIFFLITFTVTTIFWRHVMYAVVLASFTQVYTLSKLGNFKLANIHVLIT